MHASDPGILKNPQKSFRNSHGYSLIEMIIGLGVLAVLVTSLVAFFRNQSAHQGKKAARSAAMQMNKTLMDALKEDFRTQTLFAISADGKSLDITQKRNHRIVFKSECVKARAPQSHTRGLLEKAYSGFNKPNFERAKGLCISSLNCPAGTMPQVKRQAEASPTEFPKLSSDLKGQSWGSSLCFQKVQNTIRVIAESVWLTDRSGAALSVVSDELILSPEEDS